ncbi:helix-turn-helix transcriptional regulator [Streptomyces sp. CAI-85]|uniref:helix-turn-helix domain-containing protein n=1 Tax=Streptomyces sp. CAI-85 TaxID=1472662 RepID=UPI001587913C|nr:helix-turn-helix transcriptional regulator [Streptomyces sp. CAI-85]NUV58791.1 helix-turn-helix domain-containing protein [Streptomyces sp. CAI-85]
MPGPKDLDPSSSPRALLGAELRHAREKSGLSQEALGQRLFVSGSFIGQLEAGTRRLQTDMASKVDELLNTDGFFERNCTAADKSRYPNHFTEAVEAESMAQTIRQYVPSLIPGLLQTRAYAQAVFRAYQPTASDDEIENLVEARLSRARLIADPTPPLLWWVLDEAALRRVVGSPRTMAENLHRIAALIRGHRIIAQVLPFRVGTIGALGGGIKLMTFTDAPPLAYLDGIGIGQLIDDPATVARCELSYDLLRASALSPQESLALIESAAEDYAHEAEQP